MRNLILISILFILSSCASVTPNQYVLHTNDCWNHTSVLKSGQVMPTLTTPCQKIIVLPAYSMPGEIEIRTRFQQDVRGTISVDYLYEITDPLKFISEARFLLQAPNQEDDNNSANNQIESAENSIIEKYIRNEARSITEKIEAKNFNESLFESELIIASNKALANIGVNISTASIVIRFGHQTEEAIDMISAYNLLQSAGINGQEIITAQAGKPVVNITLPNNPVKDE